VNEEVFTFACLQEFSGGLVMLVIALAVDQIKGHYGAAIKLYDRYINHILGGMADMLSNGIIHQFPARFS
jgi:hypothetical protein